MATFRSECGNGGWWDDDNGDDYNGMLDTGNGK